jgi:hypothetical protein
MRPGFCLHGCLLLEWNLLLCYTSEPPPILLWFAVRRESGSWWSFFLVVDCDNSIFNFKQWAATQSDEQPETMS